MLFVFCLFILRSDDLDEGDDLVELPQQQQQQQQQQANLELLGHQDVAHGYQP